jgi:hypothetical protein
LMVYWGVEPPPFYTSKTIKTFWIHRVPLGGVNK